MIRNDSDPYMTFVEDTMLWACNPHLRSLTGTQIALGFRI